MTRQKRTTNRFLADSSELKMIRRTVPVILYVDPLFLQNEVINGPVEYNGGTIKAGYSVTDQRSFGDVYFNSGEITIKGNSVEFHSGTNVELGTELKVETIPTY